MSIMPLFLKTELELRVGVDVRWALPAAWWFKWVELVVGLLSMCRGREEEVDNREGVWFPIETGGAIAAELFTLVAADVLWSDFWRLVI